MPGLMRMFLAETAGGANSPAGGFNLLVPMIAILVVFFWLTHRSQKKKERQREEMLDSIKVGDDVVSIGGIKGRVTKVNKDGFEVRVNAEKDIKINFSKAAIATVRGEDEDTEG